MKRWLSFSQLAQENRVERSGAGYTLVEVLIVLGVTTAMFVTIMVYFSGRSARVEFTQAVRNYETKLQNVINEVESGQYQSDRNCSVGGSGPPSFSGGGGESGTNRDCIFAGKMFMTKSEDTDIVTFVGRRRTPGTDPKDVSTIYEARPVADASVTTNFGHSYDLEVTRVVRLSDNVTGVAAFGFFVQFAGNNALGGGKLAQLYGLVGTTVPTNTNTESNKIRNPGTLNDLTALPDGLAVCVRGQNSQEAIIRIGLNGSQTSITSELDTQNIVGGPC